ncbi:hypothetical protein BCR43DRAFT_483964 [Syncephalastrum racemosum]|uniref:Transmembrane protein n=1 Tax=Syncephalastrum racemosum TaxID=13706 RepID=A0A1X2HVZ7_SYNRA|nr:hypothetical protein BCR43DRAFT_483964 [Syncephalastrum racemosum]
MDNDMNQSRVIVQHVPLPRQNKLIAYAIQARNEHRFFLRFSFFFAFIFSFSLSFSFRFSIPSSRLLFFSFSIEP